MERGVILDQKRCGRCGKELSGGDEVYCSDCKGEVSRKKKGRRWYAVVAAALLLKDNGAAAQTYTAERRAVLRYFAGGNWSKPAYAFYGDDVMQLAEKYQKQIDILQQN